jgi:hypothetical protein
MSRSNVVALLNKLAAIQPKEYPAIASILACCPELACNDWITRYGPASAASTADRLGFGKCYETGWLRIIKDFCTAECVWRLLRPPALFL